MEEECKRNGGGMEEEWKSNGGGMEEEWKRNGGGMGRMKETYSAASLNLWR